MNKKQSFKIFCLTCTGMLMLALPVKAQWPTLDLSQVTNMINGWTSQIESTSSTIQSTLSVGNIQQQLGDAIGGLSKFTDAKEKAEKLAEKVEKQKKRAEKLIELKKKFEEQVENAKKFADNVKSEVNSVVDAGKNLYEEGMEIYEEGKSIYDEGMDMYEEGKAIYEEGKETVDAFQNVINGGESATETNSGDITTENEEQLTEEEIMDSEALDNEAIADLISDEEFSEGSWSGEGGYFGTEAEFSEAGVDTALPTISGETLSVEEETLIGRQPFASGNSEGKNAVSDETQTSEAASKGVLTTSGISAVKTGVETVSPTVSKELTTSDDKISVKTNGISSTSIKETPVRRAFTTQSATMKNTSVETSAKESDLSAKTAVQPAVNSVSASGAAVLKSSPVSAETTAVQPAVNSVSASGAAVLKSSPVSAETSASSVSPASSVSEIKTAPVRRAFTTSSADFLYQARQPMAFAQTTPVTFKTGTNNDGKFIYSDIIANKCSINFDEVDEEKVIECVKTWVLGMNDANAETATDWKNEYNKAKRDHVAADLAMALTQKNYSASFDTEVADDLDSKSEALTNEREEISFVGKVTQTNQEVIIRLMEAMTGQAITEAWSAIGIMDKDYYDEEETDE